MSGVVILIVDDQPKMQLLLQTVVQQEVGGRTELANNGQEALEILQTLQPTLILLDLMMPVLDGFAVARAVRANPRTRAIPILAISALSAEHEALAVGCNAFLSKPFDFEELIAKIRELAGLTTAHPADGLGQ